MIVIDTHVLVWWINQSDNLSPKAQKCIQNEIKTSAILVSSISVWEICMLVNRGKIKLSMDISDWITKIEQHSFIKFIPVDNDIAAKSVNLPNPLHQDPADRIIIATTMIHNATLITKDKLIRGYPHINSLW